MQNSTCHKQTHIQVRDMEADVDEAIAPLIKEIWTAGIDIDLSCQEDQPGIIWIHFMTLDDGIRFLNIVVRYQQESEGIYNRVLGHWKRDSAVPRWTFQVFPFDANLEEEWHEGDLVPEYHPGQPDFYFSISIRFPQTDYPVLLQRMKEYNAPANKPKTHRRASTSRPALGSTPLLSESMS